MTRLERKNSLEMAGFVQMLCLFVGVGYDLGYAWPQALIHLKNRLSPATRDRLELRPQESLSKCLERLALCWPCASQRPWFSMLGFLYESGSAMGEPLRRVGVQITCETDRELEAFARHLPVRLNLTLLVFFLPASLGLLLVPLLFSLYHAFPGG